ncbi:MULTISPECIES: sporulation protein YqfD [Geobacillus]|uniref:sporulation protein YqfD n=1 Tax=Geobacillus TaxID=129337 RepID=UPI0003F76C0B|nr:MULTISPECIES: sporulation protein YqfD [Geobacillus]ARA99044.1 sporulation protein YqfD [Geobacillus thermodenitrificans]OQP10337.1 sporulation protein YqfD [Geobacillus sp. 47C-IIb]QNU32005.1 sporulation protein YqfD [Geobacillus sp. 47C-IIb]
MKNEWVDTFTGSVRVKAEGKGTERLINACVRNGITVWNVKKHSRDTATFFIKLSDVKRLRHIARQSECKLSFVGRTGLPFFWRRAWRNSGFWLGLFVFIAIMFLLSNIVWNIDIEGAAPETEHQIVRELKRMGVERGAFQFLLDDPETLQKKLTERIHDITWVGVQWEGTSLHFRVVEKEIPKPKQPAPPRHLVAKKEAVVADLFVEEGQPLVSVNDYVQKGQLLVSGIIGVEGRTKFVPSTGKVFGETWYKSTVVLPLETTFHVLTGKSIERHYIGIGRFSLPVWGWKKPTFTHTVIEREKRPFRFWKWDLPFYYERVIVREAEAVKRSYTWEEAFAEAKKIARRELQAKLPEEATIRGEKVLHQSKESGKVRVELHYTVIENIAVPQPIVQGD